MKNEFSKSPRVFISYSHDNEEHKNWVLQLATRLRSNGVDVILDRWNLSLGSDIASFMEKGLGEANRIICVCSNTYVEKANDRQGGSGYEKSIITAELMKNQNTNWVIPLIKNNSNEDKVPRFLSNRLYINFEEAKMYEIRYEELLRDILGEKVLPIPPIGTNPFQTIKEYAQQRFISESEKYVSPARSGIVTFDYSNNNGNYSIGQDELMFELSFSKASHRTIYTSSGAESIKSVALAKGIDNCRDIKDARLFDHSSCVRSVDVGQIVIYQNKNGFYAAVNVLGIKDDSRGAENDEIVFEYFIQTNGSPDFSI